MCASAQLLRKSGAIPASHSVRRVFVHKIEQPISEFWAICWWLSSSLGISKAWEPFLGKPFSPFADGWDCNAKLFGNLFVLFASGASQYNPGSLNLAKFCGSAISCCLKGACFFFGQYDCRCFSWHAPNIYKIIN